MRTIDWVDGAIRIIDQTRLPAELVTVDIRGVDELVGHIRSLAVRGAMALGVAGALGMALAAQQGRPGASAAGVAGELARTPHWTRCWPPPPTG